MKQKKEFTEMSVKGKFRKIRATSFNGLTIVRLGKLIKTAALKSEPWLDFDFLKDPELIVAHLKKSRLGADIFRFSQKLPHTQPKYPYHVEWDVDAAAIPITSYSDWWEGRVSQTTRRNVKIARKHGVLVQKVDFGDALINGIMNINNETSVRQGVHNLHYGKSFEAVKKDYSSFLDRSEFLGAYFNNELIGMMRLVYMGEIVGIMQLQCMGQYFDKRPANVLVAAAVELCIGRGAKFLTYCQYYYGGNTESSLTEFKRRNGFERVLVPTYYAPLTWKGEMAMKLHMHLGIKRLVPQRIQKMGRELRKWVNSREKVRSDGAETQ